MRRLAVFAVCLLVFAPSLARAQEPPRTKELKDAERFIAAAMTTADTAEKRARYERALNPIQQAMAKDPDNARVWLMGGQVYAALRDFAHADSAFDKAEQLYPGFKEEIDAERITGWADAFNAGIQMMDAQQYPEAIGYLEAAEQMNGTRPETKLNLAALYSMNNQNDIAEKTYRDAITAAEGPLFAGLNAEEQTQWKRYAAIARVSIADLAGRRGVAAFEAEQYDAAAKAFDEARELNPYSRDYGYNMAQSLFAQASDLEEVRQRLADEEKSAKTKKNTALAAAKGDSLKAVAAELMDIYARMEPVAAKAREMDPNNMDLFLLLVRSYRMRGELVTDAAQKAAFTKQVDDLFKVHQSIAAGISNVMVGMNNGEANFKGQLQNLKLTPGSTTMVHFTLIGLDGAPIGEQVVPVVAPEAEKSVDFEGTVKVTGDLAGWRYTIR